MLKKIRTIKIISYSLYLGSSLMLNTCLASNINDDVQSIFSAVPGSKNQIHQELSNVFVTQVPTVVKNVFESYAFEHSTRLEVYKDSTSAMEVMGNKLREIIPKDIQDKLRKIGKSGEPSIIYLKGLPIDSYVPLEGTILDRVASKGRVSECLMLGLANLMGCEARPNPNEQEGRIIHNVAPVKGFEKTPSSKGKEPLYLHTEEAFEDNPPDFLMLYGLVGDPNAGTAYHFISDFLNTFPQEIIEEMKKPQFKIKSNSGGLDQPTEGVYSLITKENSDELGDKLRLRLYGNMEDVTPLTDKAKEVVNYVNHFFKYVQPRSISLNPGEAIIFNNGWGINKVSGIMHGRAGAIQNPYRWLQRAFLFQNNYK